jgi:hypothetical protein
MSTSVVYHPEEFAASIEAHKEAVRRETEEFIRQMAEAREEHRRNVAAYIAATKKFR